MAFDYCTHFHQIIDRLHKEHRYRQFVPLEKCATHFPRARSHKDMTQDVILWSTNDYLGLSVDPDAIQACMKQLQNGGIGAGGTRNISGTHPLHVKLEQELASLHKKEQALLFNSGYAANEWALATLGLLLPGVVMFSDADNHASMIAGIKTGKASKLIFRHNDPDHLQELLRTVPRDLPKVIVCESIYSMSGDIAPLEDFCALAKKYSALIYVDEVHGVGLYGAEGAGICAQKGVLEEVDLIQGTLSKAFGTLGGYVAGKTNIIDTIRSHAAGFIFSTALPASLLAASLCNIQKVRKTPALLTQFWDRVETARHTLQEYALPITNTASHIIPLMVGDSQLCTRMGHDLRTLYNLYVQPINYPTVPRGQERFRITPLRLHTHEMIADLAQALSTLWKHYGLDRQHAL